MIFVVEASELLAKFGAGVGSEEFVEPAGFGSLIFVSENFDDIVLSKFGVEVGDFAVDFDAGDFAANFGMEMIGEIEG